ncbi:MAG TPA: hypothetical protein VML50_17130 [Anaeromyxobacter sp.]|nr:hypothetical protein [Anaeromyxobacter sp.]
MRLARIVLLALLLGPSLAQARAWKGVSPGTSTQAEVVEKFGEPTTRTKRGTRTVLAYYGDQALEGTKQVQFHVDAGAVIQEITVFLTAPLDADTIEGTYGKPPQKTFVEDTFQKVWLYPQQGVTVYFGKEGQVEALSFAPGSRAQKAAAAESPAAAEKAPAAGR